MPFTRSGMEYDQIQAGLATGAFKPWGHKLRKLRKELAKDAIYYSEHPQGESNRQPVASSGGDSSMRPGGNKPWNRAGTGSPVESDEEEDRRKRLMQAGYDPYELSM